jgi:hypothetical protein
MRLTAIAGFQDLDLNSENDWTGLQDLISVQRTTGPVFRAGFPSVDGQMTRSPNRRRQDRLGLFVAGRGALE